MSNNLKSAHSRENLNMGFQRGPTCRAKFQRARRNCSCSCLRRSLRCDAVDSNHESEMCGGLALIGYDAPVWPPKSCTYVRDDSQIKSHQRLIQIADFRSR